MEILSDTVFRGGMQAKSVTVGNVNITSDSVVVPSLYANTLLLCGGKKSISDFTDITKYVDVGSGSSGGGGNVSVTNVSNDHYYLSPDDKNIWFGAGIQVCGYCRNGIKVGTDNSQYTLINNAVGVCTFKLSLNGNVISNWSDISSYLNGNGSTTEFIDKYIDKGSSTSDTLKLKTSRSLSVPYGALISTEFRYPSWQGHLTMIDGYGASEFFYLPGAGTYTCSGSSNTPYASDCLSSTNYTPKDNELALVGWVKNNIGSGGSSSSSAYGPTYEPYCSYPRTSDGTYIYTGNGKNLIVTSGYSNPWDDSPYITTLTGPYVNAPYLNAKCGLILNGVCIGSWSDLSSYINGCSSGCSSSNIDLSSCYFDYQNSTPGSKLILDSNVKLKLSDLEFTEFIYSFGRGSMRAIDPSNDGPVFYFPGAGTIKSGTSITTPNKNSCFSSTNYTPKDNELALVGWVKNNIGSGSGSSGSGLKLYNCLFSDYQFDIPAGCTRFVFHTIENVSPNDIGPIEIRVCADSNSYAGIYKIDDVFGYGSSLWPTTDGHSGTDIIVLRDSSDAKTVYTPRVVTTIQQ